MDFTTEECREIAEIVASLSGSNPENVFAHDGTDSLDDVVIRAFVKLYKEAGMAYCIPKNLREEK